MAATVLSMYTDIKDKTEFDRTKWRQERETQLRRIMTPINTNQGTDNCGHIVLKLNQYLSNLDSLCLKPDPDLNIEPVPITNADQVFHYYHYKNSSRARTCRLTDMETDSTDITERCVLNAKTFKEIVDLTKNNAESEILIDLTLDSKSEKETTERLKLNPASCETIVDALRNLTRDLDNRVYGFLITASTIRRKIQIHTSNFLVDEHNEIYFLDAQPNPVYVGNRLAPGCYDDLFYIASLPKLRASLSTSPTTLIQIKKELLEDISAPSLDLNDINIYESCREKITEKTLTKAEFEHIEKLALNEQSPAEINTVRAQYLYAGCYYLGMHCNANLKLAFEWYGRAAAQNYTPAVQALEKHRNGLNNEQPAKKKLDEDSQAENKILKTHIEALKERIQASKEETVAAKDRADALKIKNSALQKIHQTQVQLLRLQIKKLQDEQATTTTVSFLSTSNNASSSSTNGNSQSHNSRKRPHSYLSVNGGAAVANMPAAAAAAAADNQTVAIDASASDTATSGSTTKRARVT